MVLRREDATSRTVCSTRTLRHSSYNRSSWREQPPPSMLVTSSHSSFLTFFLFFLIRSMYVVRTNGLQYLVCASSTVLSH